MTNNDLDHDLRDTFRRHEQDVLGHGLTPSPSLFRRIRRRQTGTVLMAAVAAAAIAIAGISGLDAIRASEQTPAVPGGSETGPAVTGPAVPPEAEQVGFLGLPPEGAAPSTPERGELVLEFGGEPPSSDMWTFMWMYADGRLIWRQFPTNVPYGANGFWGTGLLERRLTPEGLDLVLSEVISTGLFDKNLDLAIEGLTPVDVKCGFGERIEVRNRDRLVSLTWVQGCGEPELQPATPEQADAAVRLVGRLADPASWLPEHAWEDQEIRAYVPSRYAICANLLDLPEGVGVSAWPTTSEIVDQLPGPVKALIYADGKVIPETGPMGEEDGCYEVTTNEARAIVRALDDAGFESELRMSLTYVFDTPELRWADGLSFATILPHGETG